MRDPKITEVVRDDPRYAYEAYQFLFDGLEHTQKALGRIAAGSRQSEESPQHHVSGPELLHGLCDLAVEQFGLMAPTVFRLWGIRTTADVGEMVFNLIDAQLLSKTESDSREDFRDVFDLEKVLAEGFKFRPGDAGQFRRGER
jgi:uncharacterized repeat protein (TIGR04138 family)